MSDLTLPDDLKEWQDALEDRDVAKQAYDSFNGSLQAKALLAEVLIGAMKRVEKLRMAHHEGQRIKFALDLTDRQEHELYEPRAIDETYGIYSEDEYFDNRERGRNIR